MSNNNKCSSCFITLWHNMIGFSVLDINISALVVGYCIMGMEYLINNI